MADYVDDYDDEFDYLTDTAKCSLCGYYYCTCCGCDCYMYMADEDEAEEQSEEAV